MLRSLKSILGHRLEALDGELGRVLDFYFDDESWTVRYMVADTSRWLAGRRVLISPLALGEPGWRSRAIPVRLRKEQVRDAPSEATTETVTRRHELELARYYSWPTYWALTTAIQPRGPRGSEAGDSVEQEPRLRSLEHVRGYHVRAGGEDAGVVEDLIAETESWVVRYVVVDARPWWPGGKVLLAPDWIERIDWQRSTFDTDLSKDVIAGLPPYHASDTVERDYEERLHDYLGRPKYWA